MVEANKFYLLPGGIFSSSKPFIVNTILGSCVSVFLYDPTRGVSCINHFMLPGNGRTTSHCFKYGNIAIPEIIRRMQRFGCKPEDIKAKVFGGSNISDVYGRFSIGDQNLTLALELLRKEDICVISSGVGGNRGRIANFYTATGDVFVKFISNRNSIK